MKNGIIDVHAHFVPPMWYKVVDEAGGAQSNQPLPEWDVQTHVEFMDANNIELSMLSLSIPHVNFGDNAKARKNAREINEYAAQIVQQYPGRFSFFGVIPLPDIKGSLEEIEYVLDVLKADGIKFCTNSLGLYLGDDALEPVFAELSKRNSAAVLHPIRPSEVPKNVLDNYPIAMMEFFFDTARSVTNLILKGTLERHPAVKVIVPHAGGVLPILAPRIENMTGRFPQPGQPADIMSGFRNLYYDLAGPSVGQQMDSLLKITDISHLLFGTDAPYPPAAHRVKWLTELKTDILTPEQFQRVCVENAWEVFPRLK